MFGGPTVGGTGLLALTSLNGTNGFKLDGEKIGDDSGIPVATAGDINDDGYPDLLIGAPYYNNTVGRSYVIFGGLTVGNNGLLALSSLNGTNGFKLDGEMKQDYSGFAGATIGDMNGDGYDDMAIGAFCHPYNVGCGAGRSYVIFGKPDMGSDNNGLFALSSLVGDNGFKIDGETRYDVSGFSISGIGDINRDAYQDLLIGAYAHNNSIGRSYVIYGESSVGSNELFYLSSLTGHNGFKIDGESAGDQSGYATAGLGDINGDGYPDWVIGAPQHNAAVGRSYVVFGCTELGSGGLMNLSSLNGVTGFKLDGEVAGDQSGYAVSAAGDVNCDGYADILIGAYGHNQFTGRTYVIFGGARVGNSGLLVLSNLDGSNGFKLDGETFSSNSSYSISTAGDINGDGCGDFLIGAYGYNNATGRAYVIFGDASPILVNNSLQLSSGATVTLDSTDLAAYDRNHNNDTLIFIPTAISHGQFEWIGQSGIPIANFTQQQVEEGNIQFVHDGTLIAPSYSITVRSAGIAWTGPQAAHINFADAPISQFPAVILLADLDGQIGFKIDGEASGDKSGFSITAADINNDSYADVVIGAPYASPGGRSEAGRSYVVFGSPNVGGNGLLPLSSLNGSNGFKIDGEGNDPVYSSNSGWSVSAAGDVNADGFPDFLIGAPSCTLNEGIYRGCSYVILGGKTVGSSELLNLTALNGSNGFKLDGENQFDFSGSKVSAAGDINQDGYNDILIGAPQNWPPFPPGLVYVIWGGPQVGNNGLIPLSTLNGTNGFKLPGETEDDWCGYALSSVGDMNGDGAEDMVIGAFGYNNYSGRSYVVFGGSGVGSGGLIPLSNLSGVNGFKLDAETLSDSNGDFVAGAGDFNKDGYRDLLVGAEHHNQVGRIYVVFGGTEVGSSGLVLLANINGTNGFKIDGGDGIENGIGGVMSAGDINGDGWIDLFIGESLFATGAGRSYVVFGGSQVGQNGLITLSSIDGISGFALDGEATGDGSGGSLSITDDVNGDGVSDLLIGAAGHNNSTGRSYVVFGDIPPTLVQNRLSLFQNATVTLTAQSLSAYDLNHPNSSLIFISANVTQGWFELSSNPGFDLVNFTQAQIDSGLIQFVHNGSSQAPSYTITVRSNGIAWTGPAVANISFVPSPTLTNNYLVVHQGEKLEMTADFLNVTDYPPDQVTFTIGDSQYGQFQLLSSNDSITQFTQQQLLANQVFFIQDNSTYTPSYQVSVSDPYFTRSPVSAAVTFYRQPVLVAYPFSMCQGQSVVMTSAFLNATDDYPSDQVVFTVSDLHYGWFKLLPNSMVTQFTQQQLQAGQVILIQDGGANAASYQLSLSDPYFTLPSVTVNTTLSCSSPHSPSDIKIGVIVASSVGAVLLSALGCLLWKRYQQKKNLLAPAYTADSEKKATLSSPLLSAIPESQRLVRSSSSLRRESLQLQSKKDLGTSVSTVPFSLDALKSSLSLRPPSTLVTVSFSDDRHEQAVLSSAVQENKTSASLISSSVSFRLREEVGEIKVSFNVKFEDLKFSEKDKLGAGAYGTVYKGVYKFNEVAIKKLHAEHFSGAALDEFKQEVKVMANMHSDYIVSLRGVCLKSPHFCIVMELMPKGSLYHLLQNSPQLPLSVLYRIALDIGYGLYHLHEAGILHRDLKSLNVLLDDRLRAKLTDFGLSKVKSEVETLGSAKGMKGTLGWMAPELFEEKASATQASDIYAYGMILWELIIRPYCVPFKGLAPAALMSAKLSRGEKQETLPEQCPPKYSELIRWCWQTPEKRPSAEQATKKLYSFWEESTKKLAESTSVSGSSAVGPNSGVPLHISPSLLGSE